MRRHCVVPLVLPCIRSLIIGAGGAIDPPCHRLLSKQKRRMKREWRELKGLAFHTSSFGSGFPMALKIEPRFLLGRSEVKREQGRKVEKNWTRVRSSERTARAEQRDECEREETAGWLTFLADDPSHLPSLSSLPIPSVFLRFCFKKKSPSILFPTSSFLTSLDLT